VLAEAPDIVIVATGGTPNLDWLPGSEHVTSAWDILSGAVAVGEDVLVIDGTGRHVALSAAEMCHRKGAGVRLVTIDESLATEQAYAERVIWRRWVHAEGIEVRYEEALREVRAEGNRLIAVTRNELTGAMRETAAGQVIFDYGTTPADGLYRDLRGESANDGVTDLDKLVGAQAQATPRTGFALHRIGDAVSSRNIHLAVLDALRLCARM